MITQLEREVAKLKQGDHVCPVYETLAQQMAAAAPYIKKGFEVGEQAIYVSDDTGLRRMSETLADAGVDVERQRQRGALHLLSAQETYLRSGKFDSQAMIGYLHDAETAALAGGFSGARFIGDMSWLAGTDFDGDQLVEYEAMLNDYLARSRAINLCQYDRARFDPALIHDILRVHPIAILGDLVCKNPYYEPPELIIRREQMARDEYKRKRVDWWINRLTEAAKRDQERARAQEALAEAENKYRMLFDLGMGGVFLMHEGILADCNSKLAEMLVCRATRLSGAGSMSFQRQPSPMGALPGKRHRRKSRTR